MKRRRRLLGFEPIFEGGWLHKGARARSWDVGDELDAIALLGDVTVDRFEAKHTPASIKIDAWTIFRDVDVTVGDDAHVEMFGRRHTGPPEQRGTRRPRRAAGRRGWDSIAHTSS